MTTIAWDGNYLASDSMASSSFSRSAVKIFQIDKDVFFGGCGYREDNLAVKEYLERDPSGMSKDKPKLSDTFAGILIIVGTAYRIEQNLMKDPIMEKFHAVGSGAPFAIVTMHLGFTAMEAVKIATIYDPDSSGEIQSIKLPKYDKLCSKPKSYRRALR